VGPAKLCAEPDHLVTVRVVDEVSRGDVLCEVVLEAKLVTGFERFGVERDSTGGLCERDVLPVDAGDVNVGVVGRGRRAERRQEVAEPLPTAPGVGGELAGELAVHRVVVGPGPEKPVGVADRAVLEGVPAEHRQPVEPVVDPFPARLEPAGTVSHERAREPVRNRALDGRLVVFSFGRQRPKAAGLLHTRC
jgi:hypothetical protein